MKAGKDYIGVAVGMLLFNEKGELFLSKRSMRTKNENGCWEAPGGSIEFGETLENAIKREMKEEYGIEIVLLKQFPAEDHLISSENQHWVSTTFLCKLKKNSVPKIMEPDKCDAIGWFSLDALPQPLSIITKMGISRYQNK